VALIARYLIDTSAAARMRHLEVSRRLRPLIEGGVVATTASLDAEALYSARGPAEYEQLWAGHCHVKCVSVIWEDRSGEQPRNGVV